MRHGDRVKCWTMGIVQTVIVTTKTQPPPFGMQSEIYKKIRELAPAPHNGGYRKLFFYDDGSRHSFMPDSAKVVAVEGKRTSLVWNEAQLGRLSG